MRERERGRERKSNAAPRASLERPFRSPPSPKVRQKRGGASVDSGEWTEVRRRRGKALRHGEERLDNLKQNRENQTKHSKSRRDCSLDRRHELNSQATDHNRSGRSRSRYSRGMDAIHRSGKRNFARSSSIHRSRSASLRARRRRRLVVSDGREPSVDREVLKRSSARDGWSKGGWEEEEERKANGHGFTQEIAMRETPQATCSNGVLKAEARIAVGLDEVKTNGGDGVAKLDTHQKKGDEVLVLNEF
ncbi:hypothetical protein L195_g055057, partial [Trifolium pratense]